MQTPEWACGWHIKKRQNKVSEPPAVLLQKSLSKETNREEKKETREN